MNVLDIPELFFAILGHLDKTSLAKCSLVCRAWREPATKLMWAQVQDLEQLMSKSIPDRTLKQFKHHHLYRLMTLPHPELVPRPEEDAETPERVSHLYTLPIASDLRVVPSLPSSTLCTILDN